MKRKLNILFTGCGKGIGAYVREHLLQDENVFGVGLDGPDYSIDFEIQRRRLSLDEHVVDIFDCAEKRLGGPLDALLNNAGMTRIDFLPETRTEDFLGVMRVNYVWPFLLMREFARRYGKLPERRVILNTTSMAAITSQRASGAYCASKAALEHLTRVYARESAGKNGFVYLNVAPSMVSDTDISEQVVRDLMRTRNWTESQSREYMKIGLPMGMCSKVDVLKLFAFCLYDAPAFCSGATFRMPAGVGIAG